MACGEQAIEMEYNVFDDNVILYNNHTLTMAPNTGG